MRSHDRRLRCLLVAMLAGVLAGVPVAANAQITAESDDVGPTVVAATLVSFGGNANGQLGIGSTGPGSSTPVPVDSSNLGGVITAIAAGEASSVAVRGDGTVWEWGWNPGGLTSPTAPSQVQGATGAVAVSRHPLGTSTVVLRTDGSLYSWGTNGFGQLGQGLVGGSGGGQVVGGHTYRAVSTAGHTLGVDVDGTVWAWGNNSEGQLGLGTEGGQTGTPTKVPGLTNVVAVAAGGEFSLALKADGTVWSWGTNTGGELGVGCCPIPENATSPRQVTTLSDITAISAGVRTALALDDDGHVWTWGTGHLGFAGSDNSNAPVQLENLDGVDRIAAGVESSMVKKADGSVWAWGLNTDGQLGTGNNDGSDAPVQVTSLTGAREIAVGKNHAMVLRRDDFGSLGEFTSLTPARILDTRDGTGRSGNTSPLGENASFDVQITGRGGVPSASSEVIAVVLNATVAEPGASSFLTVWPSGVTRPVISNLNYVAGQVVPNLVTVGVGSGGKVSVYNHFGPVHVIFDVVGYYSTGVGPDGARFHGLTPFRYFDTRSGHGGVPAAKLGQGGVLKFKVTGKGGVPASGVTAVVMNVTITEPSLSSFLTAYPDDVTRPLASNLNYVPGLTVPNLVTVRVPASGIIAFYNHLGATHLLADVVGYYDDDESTEAGRLIPLVPTRIFDSRLASPFPFPGKVPPGGILFSESAFTGEAQAVYNVTVTEPNGSGYVTLFPDPLPPPTASNLNYVEAQTVPNLVIVTRGPQRRVMIYNFGGSTHLILDKFGYFTSDDV